MKRLLRPLAPGQPLTSWRVSPIAEERFDVAPRPMQGEMDPFFFLTKEKNFIPHEYPCRTEFAKRYRDRRPDERTTPGEMRTVSGFGSPRLDLSGFWFRPTRPAARAEAVVVCDNPGRARLRLATCGGSILRVNGKEVLWTAEYKRNFETMAEVEVDLLEGESRMELFLDDLAERDTRFYAQLDWIDGPPARAGIVIEGDPAHAAAVEAALEAMHFPRVSHDGGPVTLVLPRLLPVDAEATVRIEGDFMSHDPHPPIRLKLPARAGRLEVGQAKDLPADFRHFDVTLAVPGFAASRVFGTEIAHAAAQGPAPATLAERVDETLQAVEKDGEADSVRAIARLALGDDGPETRRMIDAALPRIDDCWDCADFALVPLLWCRMRFGDLLGTDLCARIDRTVLGYRYWMDEPGDDVQWYFSENHALLFHTAAHLGGHLLPDATFVRSGRTGAEQSALDAERLRAWLDHFEAWEMAEFNSAPYFPIDLKGLTALFALSPDAGIRDRAGRGIARLAEIVANSAHQGVLTGAQGRSYEHTLRASRSLELSAIGRLLWGTGSHGSRFHAMPQLALCLRDHGLELPDLAPHAAWDSDDAQEWTFTQGQDRIAKLYHYKTRDHAIGSIAAYRWGEWGDQETLVHARLGPDPDAQVWINHPGEVIHSGYGRPSYWGGSASVPRVQQYRDLALVVFDGVAPQPDFTHAFFPRAAFEASRVSGDVAWAEAGDARLLLRASGPLSEVAEGPSAGCELRLAGRTGWWLVRLGSATRHGGGEAFAARFAELAPSGIDGDLTVLDPDYGLVRFLATGVVEAEGRRLGPDDWTVRGSRNILPSGPLGSTDQGRAATTAR